MATVQGDVGELAKSALVVRFAGLIDGISKPFYRELEKEPRIDFRLAILHNNMKASLGFDDNRVCGEATQDFNH